MKLLSKVTLRGLAIVTLLGALVLVALAGRYTLYTKGPVTYRMDRWTGQTVDVDSLSTPYGKHEIKVSTYDAIDHLEVRSDAYNQK